MSKVVGGLLFRYCRYVRSRQSSRYASGDGGVCVVEIKDTWEVGKVSFASLAHTSSHTQPE